MPTPGYIRSMKMAGIVESTTFRNHLEGLRDDPYRSLAGYVRNAGGFEKTPTAFAEFLWADFFRPRVEIGSTRADFEVAVKKALAPGRQQGGEQASGLQIRVEKA